MKLNAYQKGLLIFFVLLVIFWGWISFEQLTDGFYNYLYSLLYGLIPLSAGVIAMIRANTFWGGFKSAVGKATFFVGLGIFSWGMGSMIWAYYNFFLHVAAPYPSLADLGYAPSIFLYGLGAAYLSLATGAKYGLRSKWAKIFVVVGPIIILIVAYYFRVTVANPGGSIIAQGDTQLKAVLDVVYPLGDFVGLLLGVIISGLSFKYLGGKYKYDIFTILLGLGVMFIGDTSFSYTTTLGTYFDADFVDLILTVGTSLLSFGVLGFYQLKGSGDNLSLTPNLQIATAERLWENLDQVATSIVQGQAAIIGPLAWSEAQQVPGITIDKTQNKVYLVSDNSSVVLDNLVKRYENLFGAASREVSRDSAKAIISQVSQSELPPVLK